MNTITDRTFYIWNAIITLAAMSFLVWLIFFQEGSSEANLAASYLPGLNALLNATAACLLIAGRTAIAKRRESLHRTLMLTAFVASATFLVCYIYYHSLQGDTKFLGQGLIRPVYFFILISHILLSMIVFPMILSSIYFGLKERRKTHRFVARITFPIWLYVSVTGVVIFFMLRAYS
jgi:putative membrane protein